MTNFIKRLFQEQSGATAIEYGLILGLIVLALLSGLQAFADGTITMWETVSTKTANAISGS
jgi:pilus assembly protein Flp/PilA